MVDPDLPIGRDLGSNYPRPEPVAGPKFFRGSTAFIWRSIPIVAALCSPCLIAAIVLGKDFVEIPGVNGPLQFLIGVVASLAIIAVFNYLWLIRTSPAGLRTYNGMGTYAEMSWSTIQYKGIMNLLGIKYFRFKKKGFLFAYLVPIDLTDQDVFLSELRAYLGPTHSITLVLERVWGRSSE